MKNLFETPTGCVCRQNGVIVDGNNRFRFCTCPDGAREQEQDTSGYGKYIGRVAGEVVSELLQQLKENPIAHRRG